MKKNLLLTIVFLLVITATIIQSCRKMSKDISVQPSDATEIAKKHPKFTTLIVNQKLETYQVDENDRKITFDRSTLRTGAGCYPNVEPTIQLESWASTQASCGTGQPYQTYATFLLSSENEIVATNPNNSSQKTRGRMIVTNTSTGASVYTNNNILPVTITNAGTDPSDPTRTLYRVSWLNQSVPSNVFSGSNTIRLGLYYYTECEEESIYPYTALGNISNLGGLTACNVVSSMDVYFPTIHAVAACTCCTPDIIPTNQQIEFSRTGFTWTKEITSVDSYTPTSTELPQGYTYSVRYRNKGSNGCYGPWLSPSITVLWQ